ncbi:hypothetical protein [Ruminiclostridium papyrosolvens]|uniref:Uncharacterized protein n=1 Tax=Ruminiclostridium papyrosolvens C7 TaxID=1330534 RepID=U4R1V4_9FIRM|nr:hypothetical protein [Ruminiclostridium papyrosolvens]EPR11581.1 hypothetical protein L323_11635 [Ruminiclostridium papyrosolvens C7]
MKQCYYVGIMSKKNILFDRKYFYIAGFMIGMICCVINLILGGKVNIVEYITVSISFSWPFVFILYLIIKQSERQKKEGRTIFLSKEG